MKYKAPMQTHASFHIAFHAERPIDAHAVRTLYDLAGWWPKRQPDTIATILHPDFTIGVWDHDQLIGFARAVTDGCFGAYIEDVVVHPSYRRQGVAVAMLNRLLDALAHIETISLFCTAALSALYEHMDFRVRGSQMVMHRAGSS